ncbi:MAG: hypothetical protein OEL89_03135 [Candidatus Peregrinibacteria bacterium]|nr:hypothetical protein [Candidatus Peregrinibacteria bacterium]
MGDVVRKESIAKVEAGVLEQNRRDEEGVVLEQVRGDMKGLAEVIESSDVGNNIADSGAGGVSFAGKKDILSA